MEWRKSSTCGADSDFCVEAARSDDGVVMVRDAHGDTTEFTPSEWGAFLDGVKAGEFDDLA